MKKRILFLDIDGVLNSYRTSYAWKRIGYMVPNLTPDYNPYLDPVAVALLERVVTSWDFEIVLSSSWRIGADYSECKHFFEKVMYDYYGWSAFPIIDITPDLPGFGHTRGDEIKEWMFQNIQLGMQIDDYVILDDDKDMLPEQMEYFFRVNHHIGLSFDFVTWIEDRYR